MTAPAPAPVPDLRRVFEALPDPFVLLDAAGRVTFANDRAAALANRAPGELVGRTLDEVLPLGVELGREAAEFEVSLPGGRWFDVRTFPDGDGLAVHLRDVTERRRAFAWQARAERFAWTLVELGARMLEAGDVGNVASGALDLGRAATGAYGGVLYVLDDDGAHLVEIDRLGYAEPTPEAWRRFALTERHVPALVALQGHPEFLSEADFAARFSDVPRAGRTRALAVVPLTAAGRILGVLGLAFEEDRFFNEAERAFLTSFGTNVALALERVRQAEVARDREERYRALSDVTNDAIWDWQFEPDVVACNEGFFTLFGYAEGDVGPTGAWWKAHIHPDDRERVVNGVRAVVEGGGAAWRDEYRFARADGTYATVLDRGRVLRDASGAAVRMIGGMTDLSARERHRAEIEQLNASLEKRVEERGAALLASNEELRAFSYSVSHDLRAPLRHIQAFAGLLRRAVERGDAAGVARSLDVIDLAVTRSNALIEALLRFAQLSSRDVRRSSVKLGAVVRELRAEAETEIEASGRHVEWIVGALPEVPGDPELLRSVLANLISNAVKYSAKNERARVEIGADTSPGEVVIFVRDNGAGFDPRYADKLFGVFSRLHREDEFQGTGIGLATVRRLVARHGGRVWATGALGEGATFFFSLPTDPA